MNNDVHDRLDDWLNAWLDGELKPDERLAFEAHIGECAACRDEAAAAGRLGLLINDLAEEIEPSRDLWPAISARLEPRARHGAGDHRMRSGWMRAVAAAAAVGLIFFGGMLADRVVQEEQADARLVAMDFGGSASDSQDLATRRVTSAQAREVLPERYVQLVSNSSINARTRDTMLENLLIVNLAIRQVESALEEDPNDPHLRDMLRALYTQENQILNRVERMASTRQENVRTGI